MDEHKLRIFYEKRMGAEVEADQLGDEWKGYILRVAGGNDKQGFPMKQGVLTNSEYWVYLQTLKHTLRFEGNVYLHITLWATHSFINIDLHRGHI